MKKHVACSSSTRTRDFVSCIWDFGNVWIPSTYDLRTLRGNIENALKLKNRNFSLSGPIMAVGTTKGHQYRDICKCNPADIVHVPIPNVKLVCDFPPCSNVISPLPNGQEMSSEKIDTQIEQITRKTDTADNYCVNLMGSLAFVSENILLITSDADFFDVIREYLRKPVSIMLAIEDKSQVDKRLLHSISNATWHWESKSNKGSLIHGGPPLP